MTLIQLTGKINDQGQLEVQLPKGLPLGEVQVTLEIPTVTDEIPWEERPWTDEELANLMKVEPKTNAEIVEWLMQQDSTGWENIGVTGAEWVEEQRRKDRERSQW
jgi:hypothetical protein